MEIRHKKGTLYKLAFPAVDSASPASFKSGVSPVDTAYYKDGAGAWSTLSILDVASEIGATGVYEIDLIAAELNHDMVFIKFAVGGMADTFVLFKLMTNDIDSVLESNLKQIDGQATNGNNATLNLKQLNVTNTTGTAIIAKSTGSNGFGLTAEGDGTGYGIRAIGGGTGHGFGSIGGAASGNGLHAAPQGDGYGILARGGATSTKAAVRAEAMTSGGHGLDIAGNGTGVGAKVQGGTTGIGIHALGGSSSGDGLKAQAQGDGYGLHAITSGGDKEGIRAKGEGSGSGILAEAGITGHGLHALGGSTSGDAIKAEAPTAGYGMNLIGVGGSDLHADDLEGVDTKIGTPVALDGGAAALGGMLTKMADDNAGADFDAGTDSLQEIRDRGDAAWSAAAGSPNVLIDTTVAVVTDQTHFTLLAGSDVDNAYKDQSIVIYDLSNSDYPSVRTCSAYTGATKTVTLDEAPAFTIETGQSDAVKVFVATTTVLTGDGSNQIDLTIEEADTTPIPGVRISIMNSDSTVLLATGISDTNGEASFVLDDGSYKVLLSRIGFTFTVPEDLTVDESPETATYNGVAVSVGSPPSADNCRLYEYCVDQDGSNLAAVTSYAAITDKPFDDGAGMYETQKVAGTYDSGTGMIYWDIVKGASVLVEIQEIGLHKKYTVPDQANARLGDLTPE